MPGLFFPAAGQSGGRLEQPDEFHTLIIGSLDAVAYSSCARLYRERPGAVVHVFRQQRGSVGDGLGALEVAFELVGKPRCHGVSHAASLGQVRRVYHDCTRPKIHLELFRSAESAGLRCRAGGAAGKGFAGSRRANYDATTN
jgi:hypothetical protein